MKKFRNANWDVDLPKLFATCCLVLLSILHGFNAQASWKLIQHESFENTTEPCPWIISGTVYQPKPTSEFPCFHDGKSGLYLNFVDGFVGLSYRQPFSISCKTNVYRFSFWIKDTWSGYNDCDYLVRDEDGNILSQKHVQNGAIWQNIILPEFTTASNQVFFEIRNNLTVGTNDLAFDDLRLEVNSIKPVFDLKKELCSGDTYNLPSQDNNYVDGSWSPSFNPLQSQTYLFTPLNQICFDTVYHTIKIIPMPVLQVPRDTTICPGTSIVLFASGAENLIWSNGIQNGVSFFPEQSLTYTVTGYNSFCSTTRQVKVSIFDKRPKALFTSSLIEIDDENGTIVDFQNQSTEADSYSWNFGDGSTINFEMNPSHDYINANYGQIKVQLIAIANTYCRDTATLVLFRTDPLIFYIPNAFTPDEDNFNPIFKPVFTSGVDPTDYSMLIYNRWGNLVFKTQDINTGWDGRCAEIDHSLAQEGVFTYTVCFGVKKNDERKQVFGHVIVLR